MALIKSNWGETKENFKQWWEHKGLVIGGWYGIKVPETGIQPPSEESVLDPELRADYNFNLLTSREYPYDILPVAETNIAPGALALFLGSGLDFSGGTSWITPVFHNVDDPERIPEFCFDPGNKWWKIQREILLKSAARGNDKYLIGLPDLVENIDTLASVRGTNNLLTDLLVRPDWIKEKLLEINEVFIEVFKEIYRIISPDDNGNAVDCFRLWGPGKTAKVQCDVSAMFSTKMFEEFVVPPLKKQCEYLDYAMFHLDGHQCIPHLDSILEIDSLKAVEWTPDPEVPPGGSKTWYPMYRKILERGKSLQIVDVKPEEMIPLLDEIGGRGVYMITDFSDLRKAEETIKKVEGFRT